MTTNVYVMVTKTVAASPAAVFALLADPRRHVELDGSGMLQHNVTGPAHLALGDKFAIAMRQAALPYRTVNTVVEHVQDQVLVWETWARVGGARLFGGARWGYTLEAIPDGKTRVTHTYDLRRVWFRRMLVLLGYPRRMSLAMTRTLDNLAATLPR
jgi:polyketide cyclase/dehydrase/lipid transport protein